MFGVQNGLVYSVVSAKTIDTKREASSRRQLKTTVKSECYQVLMCQTQTTFCSHISSYFTKNTIVFAKLKFYSLFAFNFSRRSSDVIDFKEKPIYYIIDDGK